MTHNFCESCNRVRVTCTGQLYMCLGQDDMADLRAPLRASEGNDLLNNAIDEAIGRKPKGHDFVIDRSTRQPAVRTVSGHGHPSALDSRGARVAALVIALCALALMIWLGRNDVPVVRGLMTGLSGPDVQQEGTGNPELDACLKDRAGAVDKMREDGVINAAQYDTFRGRAIAYCEAQFPRN